MKDTSLLSLNRLSLILAGLGVLVLIAGFALMNRADYQSIAELLRVAGFVLTGIGVVGAMIARRQQLYGFSRSRQARYGAQAVILSLSVIGIVTLLNYLAYRHDVKWDLTETQSFTLSEQTAQIVSKLDKDVKISAFYQTSNPARQEALNRLEGYREKAGGKLSFEITDPEREPAKALQAGVSSDGTLVVTSGSARKDIFANSEEQITSAILAVTRTEKPKIYFLTGHNELDPDNVDTKMGLSSVKALLEQENYTVAKLSLVTVPGGKVPADARALIIVGPDKALTPSESQAIQEYVTARKGKLMLLLQPRIKTGLESLLATYGVSIGDNIVVDPGRNIQNDFTVPAFNEFAQHPITKGLERTAVLLPLARSVSLKSPPQNVQATELMKTTASSWAEKNLEENSLIRRDPADPVGPLSMAVALSISDQAAKPPSPGSIKQPEARLIVVGNAMFAANWFSRLLGNGDFFLNGVAWLSESEDLISIRAKPITDRKLTLTGNQEKVVYGLSIYVMPLLMVLAGAFVWWRRR